MLSTQHPLVAAYLHRLRLSTAGLPPQEQAELISSIAEHIATALGEIGEIDKAGGAGVDEAQVRLVLRRLGEPEAIAAEASGQSAGPATVPRPGALEWGGVAMLGLGSYLLPVAGTIAGLVMICLSRWWTTRQKVAAVAISVLPGLMVMVVGLVMFNVSSGPRSDPAVVVTEFELPSQSPGAPRIGE